VFAVCRNYRFRLSSLNHIIAALSFRPTLCSFVIDFPSWRTIIVKTSRISDVMQRVFVSPAAAAVNLSPIISHACFESPTVIFCQFNCCLRRSVLLSRNVQKLFREKAYEEITMLLTNR